MPLPRRGEPSPPAQEGRAGPRHDLVHPLDDGAHPGGAAQVAVHQQPQLVARRLGPFQLHQLRVARGDERRPAELGTSESAGRGASFWIMMMLGAVVVVYLFGFAVLVLFPKASRAAQAMGLSNDTLEKIYYPILRFLR